MSARTTLAAAVLLLAAASPRATPAQLGPFTTVRVQPGDSQLRVDRLRPYSVRWNAVSISPDNEVADRGYRTEEVVRGDCARTCWRRVLRVFAADGQEIANTTNMFDARTLAPILTDEKQGGVQTLLLRFDGRRVDGRQDTRRPYYHVVDYHRDIRGTLSRTVFDLDNGPIGLYLALMPHQQQTVLRFPLLDVHSYENPLAVVEGAYRVYHRSDTLIGGQTYRTVMIDALNNFGYWQYWLTEEPPFLVRLVFVDSSGRRTMYTIATAERPR